jgi:hypothetical protein
MQRRAVAALGLLCALGQSAEAQEQAAARRQAVERAGAGAEGQRRTRPSAGAPAGSTMQVHAGVDVAVRLAADAQKSRLGSYEQKALAHALAVLGLEIDPAPAGKT